jgi:hypothetical protein
MVHVILTPVAESAAKVLSPHRSEGSKYTESYTYPISYSSNDLPLTGRPYASRPSHMKTQVWLGAKFGA